MLDSAPARSKSAPSRSRDRSSAGDPVWRSELRRPRAAARHRCSRAVSDIMPAGTMTGARGARCNRGRRRRDNPPLTGAALREAWSEAEPLGCVSPLGKSRGGTPKGERALTGACRARARRLRNSVLSAFRFLFLFFVGWASALADAHAVRDRTNIIRKTVGTARSLSSGRPLRAGPVGAFAHPTPRRS